MGDIVDVTIGQNCQFFIDEYSNVYASGKNTDNQIGSWWRESSTPKILSEPMHKNVIKIASSMNRTLFLHSDGKVYYTGDSLFKSYLRPTIINTDPNLHIIDMKISGQSILLLSSEGDFYVYGIFTIYTKPTGRANNIFKKTTEIKTPTKVCSDIVFMDIRGDIVTLIDKKGIVKVSNPESEYRYENPIKWEFKDIDMKNCICVVKYYSYRYGYDLDVYTHLDINGDLYFDNKILDISPEPIVSITNYVNRIFFLTISGDVYTFDISDPNSTFLKKIYDISPSNKIISGKNVVKIVPINDNNIYIITSDKKLYTYNIMRNKLVFVDV